MTTPTTVDRVHTWSLTSGQTGDAIKINNAGGLITMQVTAISGATVTLEGSLDGTTFIALNDIQGSAISFAAVGYAELSTAMRWVRPVSASGTSTISLAVL